MKIIYTKHALDKFKELEKEGWLITKQEIGQIIKKPKWRGISKSGEETAIGLVDENLK